MSWKPIVSLGLVACMSGGCLLPWEGDEEGEPWVRRAVTPDAMWDVSWNGTVAVAVGPGGLYTSPDGVEWIERHTGISEEPLAVEATDTMIVAATVSGTLLVSSDGVSWSTRSPGTFRQVFDLDAGDGSWVAVDVNGKLLSSPDGLTWETVDSSGFFKAVAWAGTQWVAVGHGISTSPDGRTWTQRDSATPGTFLGVAWNGERILAVGTGPVLVSPNGIDWTAGSLPADRDVDRFVSTTWAGDRWIASARNEFGIMAQYRSGDGLSWIRSGRVGVTEMAWTGTRVLGVGYARNDLEEYDTDGAMFSLP